VRRRLLTSYLSITLFVLVALALPLGLSFSQTEERRLTSQIQDDAYALALRAGTPLEQSDAVSLHTPLNDETRGMIDERVLQRMRPGSFLVNTARGAVVVIDDLLDALDSGILAGAGLDVLPVEPPPPGSRLLGHPKVILTPHVAYFSAQSEIELRRKAAQNIVTWAKTGRPDYVVVKGTRLSRP